MFRKAFAIVLTLTLGTATGRSIDSSASSYVLGPEDQLSVHVLNLEEIGAQPLRIDMQGYINVALAGRIHAGGLTVESLEYEITSRLKTYLLNPTVSVSIVEYHSQPISILGAVNQPGIHQLQGHKRLFEALSLAGGLRPEAGDQIKLTRSKEWGPIPLQGAFTDPSGQYSVATVSIKAVMEASHPEANIDLRPNDVISVPIAKMVYVVGSVRRPGGFALNERDTISILQAISLAEGLDRTAATHNAVILRSVAGTERDTEVRVNIQNILHGKSKDTPLQANDILYIPDSKAKTIALRGVEALIQTGSGLAIYK